MMLFVKEDADVYFLGTTFLVHKDGYLLTVAHILTKRDNLMVVPIGVQDDFSPLSLDTVTPFLVKIAQIDEERDTALLKFQDDVNLSAPDHIIGNSAETLVGSTVAAIGYPYGYEKLHSQFILEAVVSSKIVSQNETRLLLFDTMIQGGFRGGPLVNVSDGRVVGLVSGRFDPLKVTRNITKDSQQYSTNISYAVAIEYGADLMDKEGLTVV
ncbi:MAG: serine protease [Desulfobacterales bacterium]